MNAEKERIHGMNILVATPGRLLQHMDETAYFDTDNLKFFAIDEVDLILDLGFKNEVSQIMRNFTRSKFQTMLLSATAKPEVLTTAQEYLSRDFSFFDLNPKDHENGSLPSRLSHFYMETPAHTKFDTLYSFIKAHK